MTVVAPVVEPVVSAAIAAALARLAGKPIPDVNVNRPDGTPAPLPYDAAIPGPGSTFFINDVPDFFHFVDPPTWGMYASWLIQRQQASMQAGPTFTMDDVQFQVDRLAYDLLGIIATFTNLTNDYLLATAIQSLANDIGLLQVSAAIIQTQSLTNWNLTTVQNAILHEYLPALAADNARLREYIGAVIPATTQAIESWVIADTYVPLHQRIIQEDLERHRDTAQIRTQAIPDAIGAVERQLAPVATVAATALAVANAAKTAVDDCAVPMCEAAGGAQNFKKIWDQLKGLLGVLVGVELANLTESDLEAFAARFAGIGTDVVETFANDFLEGGETIGKAGSALLGDITGSVSGLLGAIGIAV